MQFVFVSIKSKNMTHLSPRSKQTSPLPGSGASPVTGKGNSSPSLQKQADLEVLPRDVREKTSEGSPCKMSGRFFSRTSESQGATSRKIYLKRGSGGFFLVPLFQVLERETKGNPSISRQAACLACGPQDLVPFPSDPQRPRENRLPFLNSRGLIPFPFFSAIVLFKNRSLFPQGFWWFSRKIRIAGKNGNGSYP